MADPVKLVAPKKASDEVQESVLRVLRDALAEAERGEIDTIVIVSRHTNGNWSDYASQTTVYTEAIGRLEILKHKWINVYPTIGSGT